MHTDEEFLTLEEAAKMLRISYRSILRLCEEGKLSFYRVTKRRCIIAKTNVYTYLEDRKDFFD